MVNSEEQREQVGEQLEGWGDNGLEEGRHPLHPGAGSQPGRQPLLSPACWTRSALSCELFKFQGTTRWALLTPTKWEQKTKPGEAVVFQGPKGIR